VDFLEDLFSNSWMKIQVGADCTAPTQLDTGIVQGSVLSPLFFDLFLNALLRMLDAADHTLGVSKLSSGRLPSILNPHMSLLSRRFCGLEAWR